MADTDNPFRKIDRIVVEKVPQSTDGVGKEDQAAFDEVIKQGTKKAELHSLIQDIRLREKYSDRIFKLICWWIFGLLFVVFLQGLFSNSQAFIYDDTLLTFKLSDSVLIALVGGTTASVLGLFVIVANYIFPKR